ncbi:STAS domain-containing protein, partial [Actinocorallia longicatena]|uniref:STAS domain-containing protein n=1 Tax=Actinocorallia longicatena TaxID=111803 RepID=UPI0031D8D632
TRTYQPLGLHLKGELDEARQGRFEEVLNSVTPNGEAVHLDLADLEFLSLRALQSMTEYTRRRGSTSRVVLHRVGSDVASVIRTVGIEKLPGIVLGEES